MPDKRPILKRRLAPSVPLTLDVKDENDAVIGKLELRVGFDFNVLARIEDTYNEILRRKKRPGEIVTPEERLHTLGLEMWTRLNAGILNVMLWSACVPYNPEYLSDVWTDDGPDGLVVLCSYLDKTEAEKATEALWQAYMLYLPKDQREIMKKLKAGESKPNPPSEAATKSESTGSTSGPSDTASDSAIAKSAS